VTQLASLTSNNIAKWRPAAVRVATQLKTMKIADKPEFIVGIVFDDYLLKVAVPTDAIRDLDVETLADHLCRVAMDAALGAAPAKGAA
jgi:hypothetical protein